MAAESTVSAFRRLADLQDRHARAADAPQEYALPATDSLRRRSWVAR